MRAISYLSNVPVQKVHIIIGCILVSCTQEPSPHTSTQKKRVLNKENIPSLPYIATDTTNLEYQMIKAGLVNMDHIDSSILLDLKYSSTDNFLKQDVYGSFNKAYLLPFVAQKLKKAQQNLKQQFPNYSIIIFDAARPLSVQQKMWDILDMPDAQKKKYVSPPSKASLHNFGAAVDISIYDLSKDTLLDMGTNYDHFGKLAYPKYENTLRKEGKLTAQQLFNRLLLRSLMEEVGLNPITTEWWHFNACTRKQAWDNYTLLK